MLRLWMGSGSDGGYRSGKMAGRSTSGVRWRLRPAELRTSSWTADAHDDAFGASVEVFDGRQERRPPSG